MDSSVTAYVGLVMNTPIINAIEGFFGNCVYGGTCPVWTYDGGEYIGVQTFDALCTGVIADLLAYAGYIVMAMAAFAAFRIAVY